jgi:hypothetical protein
LLKGTTLAALYAEPEARISGDTDVLINSDKEDKASEVLKTLGYEVSKREEHEHHFEAKHPIGGLMEVHVELIQKSVSDMAFYNKVEYNEEFRIHQNGVKTFGFNDGLVYNAVHFIKHFVKSGAGVRHIMDMLLYMKKYEEEIDFGGCAACLRQDLCFRADSAISGAYRLS